MSGLAQALLGLQRRVSGSDLRRSEETDRLAALGADISFGHRPGNITDADLVVVSDAIPVDNVELEHAGRRAIPILRRAQCLDRLRGTKTSVLVAGAHGKSTTSAMIAKVLDTAAAAPTFVIGANVRALDNRRACIGAGDHFVAEACEAFGNLALFHPDVAVITNIDDEHIEHYGSQAKLDEAFRSFAMRTGPTGAVIAGGDDERLNRILSGVPATTFGFGPHNDISVASFAFDGTHSRFQLRLEDGTTHAIELPVPGKHAIANALACVASCRQLGIDIDRIAQGLASFTGVSRRWEDHGLVNGIHVIDDYAHHPTELRAAIETAQAVMDNGRRLVVAFQPQLYSRTRRLHKEFAGVLARCDHALLLEVDPGGERDAGAVRSALILDEIGKVGGSAEAYDGVDDFIDRAPRALRSGDLLLIAGAGNVRTAAPRLLQRLRSGNDVGRSAFASKVLSSLGPRKSVGWRLARMVRGRVRSTLAPPTTAVSLFTSQVLTRPADTRKLKA